MISNNSLSMAKLQVKENERAASPKKLYNQDLNFKHETAHSPDIASLPLLLAINPNLKTSSNAYADVGKNSKEAYDLIDYMRKVSSRVKPPSNELEENYGV